MSEQVATEILEWFGAVEEIIFHSLFKPFFTALSEGPTDASSSSSYLPLLRKITFKIDLTEVFDTNPHRTAFDIVYEFVVQRFKSERPIERIICEYPIGDQRVNLLRAKVACSLRGRCYRCCQLGIIRGCLDARARSIAYGMASVLSLVGPFKSKSTFKIYFHKAALNLEILLDMGLNALPLIPLTLVLQILHFHNPVSPRLIVLRSGTIYEQ